jgi:xanthine dehydrogenase YagR molybdenum-binding subunit
MAGWPENPRLIGTSVTRLDGLAKASGRAKYPSDVRPEGTLFGVMLYSPHAHAKITKIDASKAEKMPGVRAVWLIAENGREVRYQGDDVAAVAAETEEQARDAARAIEVKYEVMPHAVTEPQAMASGAPEVNRGGNVRKGRAQSSGDPEKGFAEAEAVIEATYSLPVITHVCLESHGLTARWDGPDRITAWSSTQAVQPTAGELAQRFQIPVSNVTVLTEVMGGGFGSKFGADIWGIAAAELSKRAGGRPVRMFLDRRQEHLAAGNRPSASATVKIGGKKDGSITGMTAETFGTGGIRGGSNFPLPYVYAVPNSSRSHSEVFVNAGGARAMRAPGHPQGCAIMEAAVDDLAERLGVDPLEMRLKNLPAGDFKTPVYQAEIRLGAELIGWANRKPRGQAGPGPIKRGMGMALHTWGGGGNAANKVDCMINPDGSVEIRSATQDIGTGTRTIMAMIAAEVLGLEVTEIKSNIGNSTFKPGQNSGGSTTAPSMASPTWDAATKAAAELLKKVAASVNEKPENLALKPGGVFAADQKLMDWKEACRKIGMTPISVTGDFVQGMSSQGVGGVQFADVAVDVETGVVRVKKVVAVQDTGLILNILTWKSQVSGGVIGGINYALFEEQVMDPTSGVMLNADMELYKLLGASDMPEIVVEAYQPAEVKARGVIGVGEPPTISTAAAIANAVANAIGVRVPRWPMSPKNVLEALASASKA